ncbi:unnamed protein product [Cuscuta campestris]|uniref:CCHC-type domain-containing protein n=1 Tax=Cuscuta campestris TaxID=132261 RepID=A0A484KD39_9ASTE|nr:unnamed protein product [Cuscuta campestris]
MRIYIRSISFQLWLIIKNGETTPMKKVGETTIPKKEEKYDAKDIKKVKAFEKAKHMIFCAINPDDYRRISSCSTAKEMWDKLEVTYEASSSKRVEVSDSDSDDDNPSSNLLEKFQECLKEELRSRDCKRKGEPVPTCFGCGELGHIKPYCPNRKEKKKKERAYMAWDAESSGDETATLCLMAHERNGESGFSAGRLGHGFGLAIYLAMVDITHPWVSDPGIPELCHATMGDITHPWVSDPGFQNHATQRWEILPIHGDHQLVSEQTSHGLPKFSLLGYDDSKIMIEAHLYALHDCMWMVLEDGPLKIQMENPERNPAALDVVQYIPKPKEKWDDRDCKMHNLDNVAKAAIFKTLDPITFSKIKHLKTAMEIWQGLGKLCEGSEDLRKQKIEVLLEKFKSFKMLPEESFDMLDERFHKILNDLASLNHILSPKEKNVRLLRSLPTEWYTKATAMEEGRNLENYTVQGLLDELRAYEHELKKKKEEQVTPFPTTLMTTPRIPSSEGTCTRNCDTPSSSQPPSSKMENFDEEFAMMVKQFRKFKKFFKKADSVRRPSKGKPHVEKYGERERNEKKKKAMFAAESDESSSSSSDEEALVCMERRVEKSNHEDRWTMSEDDTLCLMAKDDADQEHDHEVLDLSDKDEEVNEGDRMKPTEFIPFRSLPLKTSQRNPNSNSAEPTGNLGQPSNIPDHSNGDNSGNGDPVPIHPETPTTSVLQPEAELDQPVNPNQHNLRWLRDHPPQQRSSAEAKKETQMAELEASKSPVAIFEEQNEAEERDSLSRDISNFTLREAEEESERTLKINDEVDVQDDVETLPMQLFQRTPSTHQVTNFHFHSSSIPTLPDEVPEIWTKKVQGLIESALASQHASLRQEIEQMEARHNKLIEKFEETQCSNLKEISKSVDKTLEILSLLSNTVSNTMETYASDSYLQLKEVNKIREQIENVTVSLQKQMSILQMDIRAALAVSSANQVVTKDYLKPLFCSTSHHNFPLKSRFPI